MERLDRRSRRRARQKKVRSPYNGFFSNCLTCRANHEISNPIAVDVAGRNDSIAKLRALMWIRIVERREVGPTAPIKEKRFPLDVELIHSLERRADKHL